MCCPQCAAPAHLSGEAIDPAGRMMRCARCGTAWLARFYAEDPYGTRGARSLPARRSGRPRFEKVIEHVDQNFSVREAKRRVRPQKPTMIVAPWWRSIRLPAGTRGFRMWSSVAAALVLVAVVAFLTFDRSYAPAQQSITVSGPTKYAGLDVRVVKSAVEAVRGGYAVAVEGEITNRTGDEMAVPAVRVSLRADGTERYAWLVEPTTTQLGGGRTVLFRSVLAAPPTGIDEVAFSLAERQRTVVGMR